MKFLAILICIFIFSCQSKQHFDIRTLSMQQMLHSGDTLKMNIEMGRCFPTQGELQIVIKSDSMQCTLLSLPGLRHDSSVEIAMFKMDERLNALDSGIREIVNDTSKRKTVGTRLSIYLNQKLVGKYNADIKKSMKFTLQLIKMFPNCKWIKPVTVQKVKPSSFIIPD